MLDAPRDAVWERWTEPKMFAEWFGGPSVEAPETPSPSTSAALSSIGWLVEAGAIAPGRGADRGALEWHAFLWDPWSLLPCLALWLSRAG